MKTLLTFFLLVFSSPLISKENDVYFCQTKSITVVSEEGNKKFKNQEFKFKRKKNVIEFGKGGYFDGYSLNLTLQFDELFVAVSESENLQYQDGKFFIVAQVILTKIF